MRPPTTIAAALMLVGAASTQLVAPAAAAGPDRAQKQSYIVTVTDAANARGVARAVLANPNFVFDDVLNGFAARLNAGQLRALHNNPAVTAVEVDQTVSVSGRKAKRTTTKRSGKDDTDGKGRGSGKSRKDGKRGKPIKDQPATEPPATVTPAPGTVTQQLVSAGLWGLDRLNQPYLPLDATYSYSAAGAGVTAYVVDSGIDTRHTDFEGRAKNVFDAFGGTGQDCNGHGTHVAGTIGGQTHGVAKDVALAGVRVLNCNGTGSYSGIIAGLDWIANNSPGPSVANLSLGGGYSSALNTAVKRLSDSGVTVIVAAGNDNTDAATTSPASTAEAVTVAATDRYDKRATFSNYGAVVDTYAPGVGVTSTTLDNRTASMSGTSMAAPHVAGVATLYKAAHGEATSDVVHSWLVQNATRGVVVGSPIGTPNRLVFTTSLWP